MPQLIYYPESCDTAQSPFCSSRGCSVATITVQPNVNMVCGRELSKLTMDMNTIPSNGRPSRNSILWSILLHSWTSSILQLTPHSLDKCSLQVIPIRTHHLQIHHHPRDKLKASHHVSGKLTGLSTHHVSQFNQVPSLSVIKYHS